MTLTITTTFKALVDSGSTHCFVDPQFIANNKLITYAIPPIPLKLIDGTINNIITEAIELQIRIIAGHVTRVTPRRRIPISPINSAKTESSCKPNIHANSIIISAYFVEVWDTLPKNVLNPLLQRQKLRLVQRRLSLTAHPSPKTQKKLKQPFGLHMSEGR